MDNGCYFTYRGQKYTNGTRVWFTDEFYANNTVERYMGLKPSIFSFNYGNKWVFSNVTTYNFVPDRDIKEIVVPVYYVERHELVANRMRDGTAWSLIAGNILLYIVGMLIVIPFNGRLWAWIVMTYLFIASSLEKLSS